MNVCGSIVAIDTCSPISVAHECMWIAAVAVQERSPMAGVLVENPHSWLSLLGNLPNLGGQAVLGLEYQLDYQSLGPADALAHRIWNVHVSGGRNEPPAHRGSLHAMASVGLENMKVGVELIPGRQVQGAAHCWLRNTGCKQRDGRRQRLAEVHGQGLRQRSVEGSWPLLEFLGAFRGHCPPGSAGHSCSRHWCPP